jgi:CheY-like chemotaxis protein
VANPVERHRPAGCPEQESFMEEVEIDSATDLGGYRLLVVEDDYFVAQHLCTILREAGATVLGPAPNASSARSLTTALRPDCVLLDINLDGEYSFDLAEALVHSILEQPPRAPPV